MRAAVAAGHPATVEAGIEILEDGGNAPLADREAILDEDLWDVIRKARLEMHELADRVESWPINGISWAKAFVENAGEDLDEGAAEPRPPGGTDRER